MPLSAAQESRRGGAAEAPGPPVRIRTSESSERTVTQKSKDIFVAARTHARRSAVSKNCHHFERSCTTWGFHQRLFSRFEHTESGGGETGTENRSSATEPSVGRIWGRTCWPIDDLPRDSATNLAVLPHNTAALESVNLHSSGAACFLGAPFLPKMAFFSFAPETNGAPLRKTAFGQRMAFFVVRRSRAK